MFFALKAINARLTVSSNALNEHEDTITSNAGMRSHLLGRHATEDVVAKADEHIRIFKHGLFTPRDFSSMLWHLAVKCCGV